MPKPDKRDHTLVWATHPASPKAVRMPRSALHPDITSGWRELTDPNKSPKVQAALSDQTVAPPPAPETKEKKA